VRHGAQAPCLLEIDERGDHARRALGVPAGEQALLQAGQGAGVELRDARLVDAEGLPDLLHRGVLEVVEREQAAVAWLKATHRLAQPFPTLHRDVALVWRRWGRRDAARRQVGVLAAAAGGGRRRLDGLDADDGAAEPLLVGAEVGREVGERGLAAGADAQRLAGGLELPADATHAAGPGVAAQGVDHGAADPALGKGLEADAPVCVVPVHGVDEADHPILHQVAHIHARRHRGGHSTCEGLDERPAGDHATLLVFTKGLQHVSLLSTRCRLGSRLVRLAPEPVRQGATTMPS